MQKGENRKRNIGERLPRLASLVAIWLARASQRRALAELEMDRLADMGIDPAERDRECRKRFWKD